MSELDTYVAEECLRLEVQSKNGWIEAKFAAAMLGVKESSLINSRDKKGIIYKKILSGKTMYQLKSIQELTSGESWKG